MLGLATLDYSPTSDSTDSASDSTLMLAGLMEAAPFFGPFGRFYIGPSLWAGYISFNRQHLSAESYSGRRTFDLSDGPMYGVGVLGGVLLGAPERTDLTFNLKLDLNPDHHATLFLLVGVGFHR